MRPSQKRVQRGTAGRIKRSAVAHWACLAWLSHRPSIPLVCLAGQQRCLTGLEGTAVDGAGPFIEPFKRQTPARRQQPTSSSSGGIRLGAASKQPQGSSGSLQAAFEALRQGRGAELAPWSSQQLAQVGSTAGSSSGSGGNALATLLTTTYAKYQGAAGRTVGVAPGEAWRVALRAAVAAGTMQVRGPVARPRCVRPLVRG